MKNHQKEIPAALLTVKEIQKEIEEAKERFRRKDPIIPSLNLEDPDKSILEQLIDNLILVKSQEKNVAMTQYYHLGKLLNEGHYKMPPGQWTQEEPIMRFIAELFKGELEAILHLRNIRPRSLKKLERKKRKVVLAAQKPKLKLEEHPPSEPKKTKKRKINDVEPKDLFEAWLNGEVDFLEGILAPVFSAKKPCIE
jgi:hypothetical protein